MRALPIIAGAFAVVVIIWELPFIGSIILLLLGSVMAFWMKPGQELGSPTNPTIGKQLVA